MSVIGSNILAGSSGQGGGYNLTRSLRFRSSASAYLNRTPASAGNRKTWTYSTWVKRGALGTEQVLISGGVISATYYYTKGLYFDSSDRLCITNYPDASGGELVSTSVYRDPSAWYHVMVAVDTTQATNTNRLKMYVNGVQVTAFSTASYPTQNTDTMFNSTSYPMFLGKFVAGFNQYFDGYKAEENFIDGQALTPSSFGETSPTTGVWQPKRYSGTYGTNGFYLPFTDVALTSGSNAGLGKDFSGNGNYWNTNNISLTAGSTYDSMTDVPTLTSATASNFPTLNPLWYTSSGAGTLSNANLTFTQGSSGQFGETFTTMAFPPIGTAGKYYFEFVFTNGLLSDVNQGGGVYNSTSLSDYAIVQPKSSSTVFNRSGSTTSSGTGYSFGDVLQVAIDTGSGKIWYGKNNTWYSGNPATDTSPTYSNLTSGASYVAGFTSYSYSVTGQVNFGQRPFAYTPPTGYVALNTFNLPTPTIGATASTQANDYFDVSLWTGANTNAGNSVTGLNFSPDFVWAKVRSQAYSHLLYDRLRGTGATAELSTDSTGAEGSTSSSERGYLNSFDSAGFSSVVGSNGDNLYFNQTSQTYVAWNWKANGTGVTNTAGSITSTVSANTTSGFSVVTYTGTGSAATVGHGLGVAPKMILHKVRTVGTGWAVWHGSYPTPTTQLLELNTTGALLSSSTYWNSSLPTSTTIPLGTYGGVNTNGGTHVAYCFSAVAGYSAFGSYTANASTDGPFTYTGFKPRFVMVKSSSNSDNWIIYDSARETYNVMGANIHPNLSNAEASSPPRIDFLSNGFKIRAGSGFAPNETSGWTYIYAAFAEHPFKYALGR